jgi:hypothetical protein
VPLQEEDMRKHKATAYLTALLLAAMGLLTTCDHNSIGHAGGRFEVHEWGVLIGCMVDTSYFLTSRPEQASIVKEPVIYIHSEEKTPFALRATFKNGKPTLTYPEAEIESNTVTWEDVNFAKDLDTTRTGAAGDYVPLEQIIDILNDVDADCVEYDGQKARFLFYEGNVAFENKIDITYDVPTQQATFKNNAPFPVYNVILVIGAYVGRVDQLNSQDSVTAVLSDQTAVDLAADLVSEGFTTLEAQAFAALWQEPFLQHSVSPEPVRNLIYRLPQDEYDEWISLAVHPKPTKIIRSLYILVHLNE